MVTMTLGELMDYAAQSGATRQTPLVFGIVDGKEEKTVSVVSVSFAGIGYVPELGDDPKDYNTTARFSSLVPAIRVLALFNDESESISE